MFVHNALFNALNASELQVIVPVANLEAIEILSQIVLVLQKLMKIIQIFVLNVLSNVYKIVILIRRVKELVGQIEMLQINAHASQDIMNLPWDNLI
jgi:hypothetical protein